MRTILITSALLLAAFSAYAQQPAPLPDLDSGQVSLKWSDFKKIVAEGSAVSQPSGKKEPPPYDWSLSRAEYEAEVTDANVHVRARFDLQILKEGWVQVPLAQQDVATTSLKLDGKTISFAPSKDNWLICALDQPGPHVIECEFFAQTQCKDGTCSFSFACPKAPQTKLQLHIKKPDARIEAPDAIEIQPLSAESETAAELSFRTVEAISVSWTLPAEEKPAPADLEIECTAATLATVKEQHVAYTSTLVYRVLRGTANTFRFSLPADANLLKVNADKATAKSALVDSRLVVEVMTNYGVPDTFSVPIQYELALPQDGPLQTALPVALDVVRQSGWLAIAASANVSLKPTAENHGYVLVDNQEIPAALRGLSPYPLLHAFRYTDAPTVLSFEAHRYQDFEVRVANIDCCSLETAITRDGTRMSHARYDVRNNMKQFLRVELPTGADLLSAEVNGHVIKPARESDTGALLVPLLMSAENGRRKTGFPVDIYYLEQPMLMRSLPTALDLNGPSVDIITTRASWAVYLPGSYSAFSPDERFRRTSGGVQGTSSSLPRANVDGPSQRQQISRLRLAAAIQQQAQASQKQAAPDPPTTPQPDIIAESPAKMIFPKEGAEYIVSRTLIPESSSLNLRMIVAPRWQVKTMSAIAAVALFLIAMLFGRRFFRRTLPVRGYWLIGAVFAVAVVSVMFVSRTYQFPIWPLAAILAGLVLTPIVKLTALFLSPDETAPQQ
jgi:hypothetical protein